MPGFSNRAGGKLERPPIVANDQRHPEADQREKQQQGAANRGPSAHEHIIALLVEPWF
jgi:aspartyl/asparaginyl beta-hydroxylase (cupin superfamily)